MSAVLTGRWILGALAALALGALSNMLLADVPGQSKARPLPSERWQVPQSPRPLLDVVDAAWDKTAPWPAPPPPPEAAATVEEEGPVPVPVGVARARGGARAVFAVPGAGNLLLRAGEGLPGGGRVLRVSGLAVEWVDAKGQRQQREMFNSYQIQEETPPPARKGRR